MAIKKILKMYGNGFLTRQVAGFPESATDDDYVIKTFTNTPNSTGYQLVQAIDPNDTGDMEDEDIRALIELNEDEAELRFGKTLDNNYIHIDDDGITLGNVKQIRVNNKILTAAELATLNGIDTSKGLIEDRLITGDVDAIHGSYGRTSLGSYGANWRSDLQQGSTMSLTMPETGKAMLMLNGVGYGGVANHAGDQRCHINIRLYHNGSLISTIWSTTLASNNTTSASIDKSYIINVNQGDIFTIRVYRYYTGVLDNIYATWYGYYDGTMNVIVVK